MKFQKWLTGALLVICTASILLNLHAKDPAVKNLDAGETQTLLNQKPDTYILDVRSDAEFKEGHLPGAHWIPVRELRKRQAVLPENKDQDILVYCQRGGRSTRAAGMLQKMGYSNIHNFKGGMIAWETARQPVVK